MYTQSIPHTGERVALLLRESDARRAAAALASQEHALREDAQRRGDEVVAIYSDAGYSGAILDRPAIEDLLDAAERGPPTISQILANPKYFGLFASGRYQAIAAARAYRPREGAPAVGRPGRKRRRTKSSAALRPEAEWKGQTLHAELALVDEPTWRRAHSQRERNKQLSPRNTREPSLLHGLVYCGRDHRNGLEHRMKLRYCTDRRPVWRCPERAAPGGPYCRGRIVAAILKEAVWAKVCTIRRYPESLVRELREQYGQASAALERRQRRTAATRAALDTAQQALDNLEVARLRGELEPDQYARLRPRLVQVERAARKEMESAAAEELTEVPDLAALEVDLLGTYEYDPEEEKRWDALVLEERRRTVRHMVERVIVDEDGASMVGLVHSASGRLQIHDREL